MPGIPTTPTFKTPDRPELDFVRVGRALDLVAERWHPRGTYRVASDGDVYFCSLQPHYNCECGDAVWNNRICKHLIRCLLLERDREAVLLARVHLAWQEEPDGFRRHVRQMIDPAPVLAARTLLGADDAQVARLPRDELDPLLARLPDPIRTRLLRRMAAGHLRQAAVRASTTSLPAAHPLTGVTGSRYAG